MVYIQTAFNSVYHVYPNNICEIPTQNYCVDPELEMQILSCIKTLFITSDFGGCIEFTESELKKYLTHKKTFGPKEMHHILNSNGIKYYYYYGLYRLFKI